jgi:hypothetical protein
MVVRTRPQLCQYRFGMVEDLWFIVLHSCHTFFSRCLVLIGPLSSHSGAIVQLAHLMVESYKSQ